MCSVSALQDFDSYSPCYILSVTVSPSHTFLLLHVLLCATWHASALSHTCPLSRFHSLTSVTSLSHLYCRVCFYSHTLPLSFAHPVSCTLYFFYLLSSAFFSCALPPQVCFPNRVCVLSFSLPWMHFLCLACATPPMCVLPLLYVLCLLLTCMAHFSLHSSHTNSFSLVHVLFPLHHSHIPSLPLLHFLSLPPTSCTSLLAHACVLPLLFLLLLYLAHPFPLSLSHTSLSLSCMLFHAFLTWLPF